MSNEPEGSAHTEPPPLPRHELWTVTFAFHAHDETHAFTTAQHASRRLADVLPWFNKDAIALSRETDPYRAMPVYCDDDIYCVLRPDHTGPCRSQDGADLDKLDINRDAPPRFGAAL